MKDDQVIDSHALRAFVAIAEADSITEAAKRLGITQPAVSQCLKQLEAQIGTQLVVRRTSPVQLTAAGHVLKQNADAILGELRRLHALVREAADKNLVQCRLGFVTSCAEVFGSKLIATLGHRTERLTLRSGLTLPMVEAFRNREVDVLVSDDLLPGVEGLERFTILRDPMLIAVPWQQMEAARFSLPMLAAHKPLIKFGRDASIGRFSEVVLRRVDLSPSVRFETDDTHTMMSFVHDGHGWAILSALCVAQVLHAVQGVDVLELDRSRHARSIYLIARKGELGGFPSQIATKLRSIFLAQVFPSLRAKAPWMTEGMFVPQTEG